MTNLFNDNRMFYHKKTEIKTFLQYIYYIIIKTIINELRIKLLGFWYLVLGAW